MTPDSERHIIINTATDAAHQIVTANVIGERPAAAMIAGSLSLNEARVTVMKLGELAHSLLRMGLLEACNARNTEMTPQTVQATWEQFVGQVETLRAQASQKH